MLDQNTKGRLKSPEDPNHSPLTKGQQLEGFVLSSASVVITHALYERAGALAYAPMNNLMRHWGPLKNAVVYFDRASPRPR